MCGGLFLFFFCSPALFLSASDIFVMCSGMSSLIEFFLAEKEISGDLHLELRNSYEEQSKMLYTMIKNLEEAVQ
jgi:hypothetical protein